MRSTIARGAGGEYYKAEVHLRVAVLTAESKVPDDNYKREAEQYEKKVQRVFDAAEFESGRMFKISFAFLSERMKNSEKLCAAPVLLLFCVET